MARSYPSVDWEAVELRYRAGAESLRTIAADFGITEGAIRQRAKRDSWSRDLSARVKVATEAAIRRKATGQDAHTEQEAIAIEADTRSSVILRHRKDIRRAIDVTSKMLDELEQEQSLPVDQREPLAKRASTAKVLSESLRTQIGMERQAFGIADDADQPENTVNAAAAAAAGATAALNNGKTLNDVERAIRLHRLLSATPAAAPGAPE